MKNMMLNSNNNNNNDNHCPHKHDFEYYSSILHLHIFRFTSLCSHIFKLPEDCHCCKWCEECMREEIVKRSDDSDEEDYEYCMATFSSYCDCRINSMRYEYVVERFLLHVCYATPISEWFLKYLKEGNLFLSLSSMKFTLAWIFVVVLLLFHLKAQSTGMKRHARALLNSNIVRQLNGKCVFIGNTKSGSSIRSQSNTLIICRSTCKMSEYKFLLFDLFFMRQSVACSVRRRTRRWKM